MLFAFLVGLVAGLNDVSWWASLALVVQFVLYRGVLEILLKNHWFVRNNPSPYSSYLENTIKSGELPSHPWLGYLVMMIMFGVPIGTGGFLLGWLLT